jgi:hypothetical protein
MNDATTRMVWTPKRMANWIVIAALLIPVFGKISACGGSNPIKTVITIPCGEGYVPIGADAVFQVSPGCWTRTVVVSDALTMALIPSVAGKDTVVDVHFGFPDGTSADRRIQAGEKPVTFDQPATTLRFSDPGQKDGKPVEVSVRLVQYR